MFLFSIKQKCFFPPHLIAAGAWPPAPPLLHDHAARQEAAPSAARGVGGWCPEVSRLQRTKLNFGYTGPPLSSPNYWIP